MSLRRVADSPRALVRPFLEEVSDYMAIYYLEYELEDGYVHNWLVTGPQAIPVTDLDRFQGEIGLFVPDTGYPFGRIPDWLIRQRVPRPDADK